MSPAPVRAQVRLSAPRASGYELDSLAAANARAPGDADAALRYARALALSNTVLSRRKAGEVLKRAKVDHPRSPDLALALADLYYRQGYLTLARSELKAALTSDSSSAPAYARLARMAFRDWLKFQRSDALDVAKSFWQASAKRDPADTESWIGLGVLALLANDTTGAERAARRCLAAASLAGARTRGRDGLYPVGASGATPERAFAAPDPRGEGSLLLGAALYEEGRLEAADSAYATALRYLSAGARARLLDITSAATATDTAQLTRLRFDSGSQSEFLRRFWRSRDPDLTTPVNEVRLEYLTRGALAYFLFFDARHQTWDERGNMLVRFGMPEESQYNPPGAGFQPITTNLLVWSYPSLGMDVVLEDRYLNENYDLPITMFKEPDPEPDTARVNAAVRRGEAVAYGPGIFRPPTLGPNRAPGKAEVAVFRRVRGFDPRSGAPRGAESGRLELYLGITGRTEPSLLRVDAVVLDSAWNEVARMRGDRATWCASDTVHLFQMNFDLPEGDYTVGVSARDPGRRAYGSWRLPARVTRPAAGALEISDLELACAYEPEERGGPFDKPSFTVLPNPLRQIERGTPLGVYFETYGLTPDESGRSQITVSYAVRSIAPDKRLFFRKWVNPRRSDPTVQVVRDDEVPGRARFQYVTAELKEAKPGPYRLEVSITDKTTGAVAKKELDFEIVP